MSGSDWLAVVGVMAGLLMGLPLIRAMVTHTGASAEVARKSVHVGMGLICAAFPWIFDHPLPVWILAAVATVPLWVLRSVPALRQGIGSALHGVKRPSYGEVLFAPAVAAVFHLSAGDALLHVIPIGILTVADAAGALAGTRWGKRHYGCGEGLKTVEGSAIFLITAFACVLVPLMWVGRVDVPHALWIALILSTLAMMAEGLSDRGFDNLILPLGALFILERLLPLEATALAGRAVALGLLLGLVLMGARWSTLSGGALLGSALLGYGCAILADWRFALPPAAVFVYHLVTTRRHRLNGVFDHRLDAVLSHALAVLPWVIACAMGVCDRWMALAGVSFAMVTQLAILEIATSAWLGVVVWSPWPATLKGWVLAAMPGLVWFWPQAEKLLVPVAVAAVTAAIATLIFQGIRLRYRGHATGLWAIKGLLALAASLPALLYIP